MGSESSLLLDTVERAGHPPVPDGGSFLPESSRRSMKCHSLEVPLAEGAEGRDRHVTRTKLSRDILGVGPTGPSCWGCRSEMAL